MRASETETGLPLMDIASGLFVNGHATSDVLEVVERASRAAGIPVLLVPRWGELVFRIGHGFDARLDIVAATPSEMSVNRVAAIMRSIDVKGSGGRGQAAAVMHAAVLPPAPLPQFALAAAAGACALAIIFGEKGVATYLAIVVAAASGAVARRFGARWGGGRPRRRSTAAGHAHMMSDIV